MKQKLSIIMILLIYSFVFWGCATKIPVSMCQPAEFHQASMTRTVAVLPFNGPGGADFAAELEALLAGVEINGKPYFTLVDRSTIDKVMSEMRLSHSAMVDQNTAVKLGKLIGAQGIYTGIVNANNTRDSHYKGERTECVQRQMKRDSKGNVYEGECVRWRNYYVSCTKRQANFAVTPKLVDIATARIVYSTNRSGLAESSGCEDGTPPKTEQELLDSARGTAKSAIRRDIAPYYKTVMIKLKDSTDGIELKPAKEKLKLGNEFADKKRMDAACSQWNEAKQMAPNSASLTYNLAVCAESAGDYENALKLYRQSDQLIGKPDEDVTIALSRVNTALNNQKKLKEQMRDN